MKSTVPSYTIDLDIPEHTTIHPEFQHGKRATDAVCIWRGWPVNGNGSPVGPSEVWIDSEESPIRRFWWLRDGNVFRSWRDDKGDWQRAWTGNRPLPDVTDEETKIGIMPTIPSFLGSSCLAQNGSTTLSTIPTNYLPYEAEFGNLGNFYARPRGRAVVTQAEKTRHIEKLAYSEPGSKSEGEALKWFLAN